MPYYCNFSNLPRRGFENNKTFNNFHVIIFMFLSNSLSRNPLCTKFSFSFSINPALIQKQKRHLIDKSSYPKPKYIYFKTNELWREKIYASSFILCYSFSPSSGHFIWTFSISQYRISNGITILRCTFITPDSTGILPTYTLACLAKFFIVINWLETARVWILMIPILIQRDSINFLCALFFYYYQNENIIERYLTLFFHNDHPRAKYTHN